MGTRLNIAGSPGPYYAGWQAYQDGKSIRSNPFLGKSEAEAWQQGFADAREEDYLARKGNPSAGKE